LEHVASRPAVVGDKLTVTRMGFGTTGFSAPEDMSKAVCVLPGTEIAFDEPIQGISTIDKTFEGTVAVFTQIIRPEMTWGYHKDGLEMPNGDKVLLTHLMPGQKATVLQLPVMITHLEIKDTKETETKVDVTQNNYAVELLG
jgi:hypothetical protein